MKEVMTMISQITSFFSSNTLVLAALSDNEIISMQTKFQEDLHIVKFWFAVLRDIGWSIIYQLLKLLDVLDSGGKAVSNLMDFFRSKEFVTFIAKYEFVTWALAGFGILFLFYKLSSTKKREVDTILNNTLIAISMMIALPMLMAYGADLFKLGRDFETATTPTSLTIAQNNITDVYKIDKEGWSKPNVPVNDIKNKDDLRYIDMSEVVDTGGWFFDNSPLSDKGKDVLSKKTVKINNEKVLAKLDSKFFGMDEGYFRYSWHPFIMTTEILIFLFIALFFMFKFSYLALNQAILLGFFNATAFTDLHSGKRNMLILDKIKAIFIVAYFMFFMQSVLNIYFQYINAQDLNAVWSIIAKLGGAFLCMQGPDFIEQIFGIEGGSGNMAQTFMAMKQGADGIGSMVRGAGNAVKGAVSGTASAMGNVGKGGLYGGSAIKGIFDGLSGGNKKGNSPLGGGSKDNGGTEDTPLNPTSSNDEKDNPLSNKETGGKSDGNSMTKPSTGNNEEQSLNPLNSKDDSSSNKEQNDSQSKPMSEQGGQNDSHNPLSEPGGETGSHQPLSEQDGQSDNHQPLSSTQNEGKNESGNQQQSRKDDTVQDVVRQGINNKRTQINQSNTMKKANRIYDVSRNTVKEMKGRNKK